MINRRDFIKGILCAVAGGLSVKFIHNNIYNKKEKKENDNKMNIKVEIEEMDVPALVPGYGKE